MGLRAWRQGAAPDPTEGGTRGEHASPGSPRDIRVRLGPSVTTLLFCRRTALPPAVSCQGLLSLGRCFVLQTCPWTPVFLFLIRRASSFVYVHLFIKMHNLM